MQLTSQLFMNQIPQYMSPQAAIYQPSLNLNLSSLQCQMRGSYDTDYHDCHLAYYDSKSKSTLDSDRSCGSNNEGKEFCSDDKQDEFEIDVQPKRKQFSNAEDKQKFIQDYQKKYKTEMCKNWEFKGHCRYGDKCCYAHGQQELRIKTHLQESYKTKPCKNYFLNGYCNYGNRCQYIHSDIKYYKEFYDYYRNICSLKNITMMEYQQQINGRYFGYDKALKVLTTTLANEYQFDILERNDSKRLSLFKTITAATTENNNIVGSGLSLY